MTIWFISKKSTFEEKKKSKLKASSLNGLYLRKKMINKLKIILFRYSPRWGAGSASSLYFDRFNLSG
jgi:hypothetical protein